MKNWENSIRWLLLQFVVYLVFVARTFHQGIGLYLPSSNEMCESTDCQSSSSPTEPEFPFTMSACLIVKEDNRILPEWLAYHYEVLPLRHLIIADDPYSKISPEPILEKFRSLPNMKIELWGDQDYLEKGQYYNPTADRKERLHLFLQRQTAFMEACLDSLKRQNRTWTVLIDPDEYWVFNDYDKHESAEPCCFQDINYTERAECLMKFDEDIHNGLHPRTRLPKIGEATVADYLASELNRTDRYWRFDKPCMIVPRVLFGNNVSSPNETYSQVPDGFDPEHFYTLRYRHHQAHQNRYPGKPLMDASQYDASKILSPHHLNEDLCVHGAFVPYAEAMFRVHHYIGPREECIGRKSDEQYKAREAEIEKIVATNDKIRGWLESFVQRVGKEKALELTEGLRTRAIEDMANLNNEARRKLRYRF